MSFGSRGGQTATAEIKTHTLEAPGAKITDGVREAESGDGGAPLRLVGSPMDANGFMTPAGCFPDRTVVTFDPRATARSAKADPDSESAPTEGMLARRGGEGVAQRLEQEPVTFPGGHGGFLGDEYGQPGEPEAFAATLRGVLG